MRIPVFLDGWDIDCCLAVPAVGDRVLWSLIWSDEPDHPAATVIRWAVEQPLELDEEESRHIGVASGYLLTHGPISAWWRGGRTGSPAARRPRRRGPRLRASEQVPATGGRALEVSLVIGTERETGRGHEEEVPGGTSVWPVAEGRSWDDWEDFAALAGPLPAGQQRSPRGVLVVDPAP